MEFKKMHYKNKPLIIANVWDVPSAKIAEKLKFQAIGTSSSAIASILGYNDGEEMEFSELEYFVNRILNNTNLPLTVDLEAGYSRDPVEIVQHIKSLVSMGIVGINIEDSIVDKTRKLLNPECFSETLAEIVRILGQEYIDIFINVRTDTFILLQENRVEETKKRIKLYENAGASGIFTPCIENEVDIREIVSWTSLPVNVMCMPNLPDFDTLAEIGVKRISMGNFIFDKMYSQFQDCTENLLLQQSFNSIF